MHKSIAFIIAGSFVMANAISGELFLCKTSKHTVAINSLASGEYQYKAWNKPKSITEKPDLVLVGGKEITEGTGVCRHTRWDFDNNNVQYEVSTPVACTESIPPENATGQLSVFINGEVKKSWWCFSR